MSRMPALVSTASTFLSYRGTPSLNFAVKKRKSLECDKVSLWTTGKTSLDRHCVLCCSSHEAGTMSQPRWTWLRSQAQLTKFTWIAA
eukprot:756670-Hanusia_phi.AAC.16